ncbi:hypothetical protein [Loktanella sp. M215]|uniref:hypothetical protein n=1 Tax=Loktanella sp. M215 TaxID=2675431 RepID=UPI001F40143D|nr:hypothetical protein [Loktanella sp. M215]MCF7702126.1 hypothetical protein [Loktanella sp. M215]
MRYIFTTCALNYYPNARLLAASAKAHLGDVKTVLMLADTYPSDFDFGDSDFDEVWPISELEQDLPNHMAWVFGHSVMELATAIKGFVLKKLLERKDCEVALFLDPDCEIHSDLTVVFDKLYTKDIVLTPHCCLPHTQADWIKFELNQHRVGTFNLGFLGVRNSAEGKKFADWWWHRLQRHCVIDAKRHLFTDQKWIDLAPSYFDHVGVIRRPTLNLARWNTFQREVTRNASGTIFVDGLPLDFVHYSGFMKVGSKNLGMYDVASEPWIKGKDVLDQMSNSYAERLLEYQQKPVCQNDWTLGRYRSGQKISDQQRRLYKMTPALNAQFPQPFEGGEAFLAALVGGMTG